MLDYWKLWIEDKNIIAQLLAETEVAKCFVVDEEGILRGTKGSFGEWQLQTLRHGPLQITGSLHKYWNCGTNENDFSFPNVQAAIKRFCNRLNLPPDQLLVKNLEFGFNLQPALDASIILNQIICFNRTPPIQPYANRQDCYFMEFAMSEYYLKIYDKGRQYRKRLPDTPNTLRIEVKAMNSGYLKALGVCTVADLMRDEVLLTLAQKLIKTIQGLILDDQTIKKSELTPLERKLYTCLSNPRNWNAVKGKSTSTHRHQAQRFRQIVEQKGERKIYSLLDELLNDKVRQLSQGTELALFPPNIYLENR